MKKKSQTDGQRLRTMTEAEIVSNAETDPDAPLTDAAFWEQAQVVLPRRKVAVSIRLDPDVVAWFKQQGRPYQTLINSVLKAYVEHQKQARRDQE
jgi:uncharacterized protein (DUF4415 family)